MKKLYSIILLGSFLVGVLQPILPMMEYQLYEGNVSELFQGDDQIGTQIADHLQESLQYCLAKQADEQEGEEDPLLLDDDYYPIAVDIAAAPAPNVLPNKTNLFWAKVENITDPTFLPNPPPPRVS